MKKAILSGLLGGLLIVGATVGGYELLQKQGNTTAAESVEVMTGVEKKDAKGTYREYTIEAKAQSWELKQGVTVPAWTFGGTVPGTQIRAKQGERVKVVLKNSLQEPVSIHWHGYPVPIDMDGIPGVTQNAIKPGESFTYEFTADLPGTYWYHSHQDSANQIDRGMYGSLVVEPKDEPTKYDRDYTLVLDEWAPDMLGQGSGGMDHSNMQGMDHSNMQGMDHSNMQGMDHSNMQGMDHSNMQTHSQINENTNADLMHDEMMKQMYTVFSVNGKAGAAVKPLQVTSGDKVRLRLINAGLQTHLLHFQHPFRIIATDGQPIERGAVIDDKLLAIAPGERYDVEFIADSKDSNDNKDRNWSIASYDDNKAAGDMVIPIQYGKDSTVVNRDASGNKAQLASVDMTTYNQQQAPDAKVSYDIEKTLQLSSATVTKDGQTETVFTINGKSYPDTEALSVKKGQRVKLTLVNQGNVDHPMHLHGHFFQVLAKNGKPLTSSLVKDTLNVRPGESYSISFVADNDGDWMLHCHELHHAAAGMMTHVQYNGYQPNLKPDPSVTNIPE